MIRRLSRWLVLLALLSGIVSARGLSELRSSLIPGARLYLSAPAITDRSMAQFLVDAAFRQVELYLVFDRRAALGPNAYTAHLSTLPNTTIRLAPGVRRRFLIIGRDAFILEGGLHKASSAETRRLARVFEHYWQRGQPWVYIPKAPPGYVIYKTDPLEALFSRVSEMMLQALEAQK